ncbi:MAG TPA: ABATE domain-containing protein [Rhizomicrobium sp.]|nr:ABATE domain-containing protein [Rhizomicrobium sp.]
MIDPTDFVAGALSLDFINTVGGTRTGASDEKLGSYGDLLDWAVMGGAMSKEAAGRLASLAERDPAGAARQLAQAKSFREALHAVFSALMKGEAVPKKAMDAVNSEIGRALAHARLAPSNGHYAWSWDTGDVLDAPLWPVARDAGDLLTEGPLQRLRECASDTCGWLFLDTTKNRSRRWCDMKGCGNRDKVRRYRRKAG